MNAQIAALRERANVREPIRSRHGGNYEAARVYRAFGRECHMAVYCHGQEPGRIYRLGCLTANPRNSRTGPGIMFNELRRAGFIEGQNLIIDWHNYVPRIDLLPEFAAELVTAKADVIYAGGDAAIRAAQRVTPTIPILGLTQDMVGQELVNRWPAPAATQQVSAPLHSRQTANERRS